MNPMLSTPPQNKTTKGNKMWFKNIQLYRLTNLTALMTGELSRFLPQLIAALGGEVIEQI